MTFLNNPRMEDALAANPEIGRKKLMKLCGVSSGTAQRFLERARGKKPAAPLPQGNAAPPDKYAFLNDLQPHEIELLKKSITSTPARHTPHFHEWSKSSFKFAFITDTHIGHRLAFKKWWDAACDLIGKEKCDFVLHAGDITDGMSGRPGHVYELEHVGINAQVREAVARFRECPAPIKGISGNHDLFSYKVVGADPGAMIAEAIPDKFEYLGMDEADIEVQGIKIKLWHGGDGSSYATSYRTQKFVEGLTGGEKPHILLSGHAHKSIYHSCRSVAVFEGGTLCGQTGWMRGKKLAAHCGFWVIEVWPNAAGLERIRPEWIPFFS